MESKKYLEKKLWEQHIIAVCCFEQILGAAPHKTTVLWPLASLSHKPLKYDEQDLLGTVEELRNVL